MIRSPGGAATTSQFVVCISRDLSILFWGIVLRCYDYQTALRGKVEGQRSPIFELIRLQVRVSVSILTSVVNPNTDPLGLLTLMKDQRSPICCTYAIAS